MANVTAVGSPALVENNMFWAILHIFDQLPGPPPEQKVQLSGLFLTSLTLFGHFGPLLWSWRHVVVWKHSLES